MEGPLFLCPVPSMDGPLSPLPYNLIGRSLSHLPYTLHGGTANPSPSLSMEGFQHPLSCPLYVRSPVLPALAAP